MPIDQAALAASIARLERAAGGAEDDPGADGLVDLVITAADAVFGLSGVGLMFVDEDEALRYVAASGETIRALETAQEQLGEGPCLDCLVLQRVVRSADITVDDRYRAVGALTGPLGVRAVLGVPVEVSGVPVGSLNVYRDRAHEWPDDEVDALLAFARVLGSAFTSLIRARRGDVLTAQLRHALDHRVTVERAIGFLMGTRSLDPVTAFDVLRRAARRSRRTVGDVAAGVLSGDGAHENGPHRDGPGGLRAPRPSPRHGIPPTPGGREP
ncbi:MAG: GAF and ANTAR domain-containing protein [Pseudonocardiales bacterium]|nr:GAF and ANTAR domain-containing protein [Pseudonocardiales bacterium]